MLRGTAGHRVLFKVCRVDRCDFEVMFVFEVRLQRKSAIAIAYSEVIYDISCMLHPCIQTHPKSSGTHGLAMLGTIFIQGRVSPHHR